MLALAPPLIPPSLCPHLGLGELVLAKTPRNGRNKKLRRPQRAPWHSLPFRHAIPWRDGSRRRWERSRRCAVAQRLTSAQRLRRCAYQRDKNTKGKRGALRYAPLPQGYLTPPLSGAP